MRATLLFAAAVLLTATATPASAFLSLIRQGVESTDVPNANDHFGATVCTGDFNGDGLDDLATAAPDESNGLINLAVHGMVVINYGTVRGLSHQGSQSISVGDLGTAAARFGRSLASADFDQDGYDDLAVGIPQLDNFGGPDRGAVWIYRGGASGLQLAPYRQISYDDIEVAPEDYANFGWALAAGDFNNDTYPDIATSAIGQSSDTGVLYFFYGSNVNGITTTGFDKMFPFTVGGSQALGSRFGWSLAAGQLDGQGGDDLVIGAPQTFVNGQTNSGRVYFYYSNGAVGITATDAWFIDATNMAPTAPEGASWFGYSVATGHMAQVGGQEDVAIGAPDDQYGMIGKVGSVFVVEFDLVPRGAYDSISRIRQLFAFDATTPDPGDRFGEAVAVGRYDIGNYEDLAIGAPGEDIIEQSALGTQVNSGMFHILYGKAGGPDIADSETYSMADLNNYVDAGENLGAALAFGRFDGTSREGLAVGAPDADYDSYESGGTNINDAGQVHIFAPWRQPVGFPHRSSVSLDCNGFIVYGQRPFQRLRPASTTKTLTLALACDAIADMEVDPDQFYPVPDWVADSVGGSQTPLVEDEELTFRGLMQTMMTVSGNDSAMLLGAIMSGDGGPWEGWSGTSPAFAAMMETKANQLGLSAATSMTNAAGIDSGDHYVTALDWALLSYLTIQDDCVKEMVNTSPWIVERRQPVGGGLDFFQVPQDDGFVTVFDAFNNGFVNGVKGAYPDAVGVKGGNTPGAWRTGLGAGDPFGMGMSAVSSFGTRRDDFPVMGVVDGDLSGLQGSLLAIAETFCDDGMPDDILMPPNDPDPAPWGTLTGILPCPDAGPRGMTMDFTAPHAVKPGRTVQIDLLRHSVTEPELPVLMMVGGTQDINIGVGELKEMGIAPHQNNLGLEIRNSGETTAVFEVRWGSAITSHTLAPGAVATIPGVDAPGRSFTGQISSLSTTEITLEVNQLGYTYDLLLEDGVGGPSTYSLQLTRMLGVSDDIMRVYVRGMDDDCDDDKLDLVVRADGEIPTAIDDPDGFAPPRPASFQLLAPVPNPFNPRTAVQFDLPRAATIDLDVFDVRGRHVRALRSGQHYDAGRHRVDWDGTDDSGRTVASGVYLIRLASGGQQETRRVTMIK